MREKPQAFDFKTKHRKRKRTRKNASLGSSIFMQEKVCISKIECIEKTKGEGKKEVRCIKKWKKRGLRVAGAAKESVPANCSLLPSRFFVGKLKRGNEKGPGIPNREYSPPKKRLKKAVMT